MTDLVNLPIAYWSRKRPLPNPPDLERRLAYGRRMHYTAGFWFSRLPGFLLGEGRLEGGYVGIERVVGRIDYLLDQSVLEFKTKQIAPRTPDDLCTSFPHDLEQTAFYGVLLPNHSRTHYLIFLDNRDDEFRVFRCRIREPGVVLTMVRQRSDMLRTALASDNPTLLGRCRYSLGCKFQQSGVCSCSALDPLDLRVLRRAIEVERDLEFEGRLQVARETAVRGPSRITPWNLIAPRRRLLSLREAAPEYSPDTTKIASLYILRESIRETPELHVDTAINLSANDAARALGLQVSVRFVTVHSARDPNSPLIVPCITRASHGSVRPPRDLYDFYVAELAVSCALADNAKGVVFVSYPDVHDQVVAYGVSFRRARDLRNLVEAALEDLRQAEQEDDPQLAGSCPAFMEGSCGPDCLCRS